MKCPIEKPQFSVNQKWKYPPTNIMKVKVDAAVPHDINGGVGVVIRDEMGIIMALAIQAIPYPFEAHEAEAYAAFWGLNFIKDCCFAKVILKSDNTEVMGALKQRCFSSCFGTFIIDAISLIKNFRSVEFSHVKREGNRVAHELATLALTNPNCMWMEDVLNHIQNLALLDVLPFSE
ncbi:uncharacterized protein LOC107641002 [Arachis ipaensis]|uniref:uncharacterized protein LOC107641002 n=1 Tax=Arachis ipaensis TaxID=130454 RepID=UPI0007AFAE2A|nr:uncharacterized protein LOC107641002 [Arachis ipaensis]XP_025652971.1 uncharacterized protein LOC112748935 [Arachis hypogaea]